ncbi:unnamed protein product [Rotaria socialis]|uniref:Uncharacterized protein n=1 Tax=Rotaria socialis TaxID=392032 RepID=A0A822BHG4_9BILA|nr:unnamed protein product [Rotaria socialis]
MLINLDKRNSYISKSILSILQINHTVPKSKSPSNQYKIPSSLFTIVCIISIWAIVFYFILGLCYLFNSGILLQDLDFIRLNQLNDINLFTKEIYRQFYQLSVHCFVSVSVYLILFFICFLILQRRNKKEAVLPRSEIIKPYGACNKR